MRDGIHSHKSKNNMTTDVRSFTLLDEALHFFVQSGLACFSSVGRVHMWPRCGWSKHSKPQLLLLLLHLVAIFELAPPCVGGSPIGP
jgi:hypothetical protein